MSTIYDQDISQRFKKSPTYYATKRSDLFKLIPKDAKKILDVGCGTAEQWIGFDGEVSGIELNSEAAAKAKNILKTVISDDVEKAPLSFADNYFDCIVFADVLEHLYDPWGMILKLKKYLKKEGRLLISIPNLRHYSIIKPLLMKGEFSYQESGILDVDHVRFFTLKEVTKMLQATGFDVIKIQPKISSSKGYRLINKTLFGLFDHFLTEQYYILAQAQ